MINSLNILLPEIFLALSVFSILMIGVFTKKRFNLIFNLTSIILLITIVLIYNSSNNNGKIFLDSFSRDSFSDFFKILILFSSFFVLNSSRNFIKDNKIDKFEYPIIILISILGMFFMVSSNDLILFYLGLELQSLALYILASIDRDNLRSSESGIKYFVLSALSSGLLLYGCSLLYGFTGSTNFELIAMELNKFSTGGQALFKPKGPIDVTRSFCYITDLIDGLNLILEKNQGVGIYNIGNDHEIDINIHAPSILTNEYCSDPNERLVIYKRLSSCESLDQLKDIQEELIDRFGVMPEQTQNLIIF